MWYACDGDMQFVHNLQVCNSTCIYYLMLCHMLNIMCVTFYAVLDVTKYHFSDMIWKIEIKYHKRTVTDGLS